MNLSFKRLLQLDIKHFIQLEFFILCVLLSVLSSCSWQEYFVISNPTGNPVPLEYSISSANKGFGTFNTSPEVYSLTNSNEIDWNKKLTIEDSDTSKFTVKIMLPSKSVAVIGYLMNDHYTNHNQKNSNDRVVFTKINIGQNQNVLEITPENFEQFFEKNSGNIEYRIK